MAENREREAAIPGPRRQRIPVGVVMQRRQLRRGMWSVETWEAVGVVAGEATGGGGRPAPEPVVQAADGGAEQVIWRGLALELFPDEAESYYHNLRSDHPSLFVICHPAEDDGEGWIPILVSASQDEAGAYMEAEGEVFAVPMPPEVYRQVERYVLDHYRPAPRRRRRRRPWHPGEKG